MKLNDGELTITLNAPVGCAVGDTFDLEFGFVDDGPNIQPLKVAFRVQIGKPEEKKKNPPGKRKPGVDDEPLPKLGLPSIVWVTEEQWREHDFDVLSGAEILKSDKGITVYVNQAHNYLKNMRLKVSNEADRQLNEFKFRYGLGLLAISIYQRVTTEIEKNEKSNIPSDTDPNETVRIATSGIASVIVPIMDQLAGKSASEIA